MFRRREFLMATGGLVTAGLTAGYVRSEKWEGTTLLPEIRIRSVELVEKRLVLTADDGTAGRFPLVQNSRPRLEEVIDKVRELLVGRDPLQTGLEGDRIWEAIHPGRARLYAKGRDPLTGKRIDGQTRGTRHSETGRFFIAMSAVDIALWDLRARLADAPLYKLMGKARRQRLPVYWRPGEPKDLEDARSRGREAYDQGYRAQKWYFLYGPADGPQGLRNNVELVRVLREELGPEAKLLFDNHNMRYANDAAYAVALAREIAPYKIHWLEEPVCPEYVEGYARIKGETGIPIAGGEHWYTRWPVGAFLERKCIDFVQSDPVWCGGISEWLRICKMVRRYPGVKVVPHITSPWIVAPHCVAAMPEALCPMCEYNSQGGRKPLADRMSRASEDGEMLMTMPESPGLT